MGKREGTICSIYKSVNLTGESRKVKLHSVFLLQWVLKLTNINRKRFYFKITAVLQRSTIRYKGIPTLKKNKIKGLSKLFSQKFYS